MRRIHSSPAFSPSINSERTKDMLHKIRSLPAFTTGTMFATLIASIALNLAFYSGKIHSPEGAYCEGFYAGAQNAITGTARAGK